MPHLLVPIRQPAGGTRCYHCGDDLPTDNFCNKHLSCQPQVGKQTLSPNLRIRRLYMHHGMPVHWPVKGACRMICRWCQTNQKQLLLPAKADIAQPSGLVKAVQLQPGPAQLLCPCLQHWVALPGAAVINRDPTSHSWDVAVTAAYQAAQCKATASQPSGCNLGVIWV